MPVLPVMADIMPGCDEVALSLVPLNILRPAGEERENTHQSPIIYSESSYIRIQSANIIDTVKNINMWTIYWRGMAGYAVV